MSIFPIIYFLTPYPSLIQDPTARYAAFLVLLLAKGIAGIVSFPCITILLTNSASSVRILGTLNGFATTFSGLGRAAGPAALGALFSWGSRNGYAIVPWWSLGLVGVLGAITPWFIVEGDGPSQSLPASADASASEDEDVSEPDDGPPADRSATKKQQHVKSYGTMNGRAPNGRATR